MLVVRTRVAALVVRTGVTALRAGAGVAALVVRARVAGHRVAVGAEVTTSGAGVTMASQERGLGGARHRIVSGTAKNRNWLRKCGDESGGLLLRRRRRKQGSEADEHGRWGDCISSFEAVG